MELIKRLYSAPWLLLTLAALFFGGNTAAGRLAVGNISAQQLVLLRWLLVALAMALLLRGRIVPAWRAARPHALRIFWLGFSGFTCFNTLFYFAAHKTSAVNLGILQGTIPVWVLIGAFAAYRTRVRAVQMFGVLLTFAGVLVLAARGDLAFFAAPDINGGDLMMLAACFSYAFYTVGLKNRPQIGGLEFFFLVALAALISSIPLALHEILSGTAQVPTMQGWLVLAYVAIFPSCLSQIFFIRGVELIGPGRAAAFLNLVPVFAALCALFIGEILMPFQFTALALVLCGIWLSEKSGRRG